MRVDQVRHKPGILERKKTYRLTFVEELKEGFGHLTDKWITKVDTRMNILHSTLDWGAEKVKPRRLHGTPTTSAFSRHVAPSRIPASRDSHSEISCLCLSINEFLTRCPPQILLKARIYVDI
jgi:hypothetical protein